MKTRLLFMTSVVLLLSFGCSPSEMETLDTRTLEYTLNVTNDDYTATTVLDGIGNTKIAEVLNQPSWVSSVTRGEDLLDGSMVLYIDVKSSPSLGDGEDTREAVISVKMTNGATAMVTVVQRAGLPVGFNADDSPSVNKAFEDKWWEAMNIELVTSAYKENAKDHVLTETTPLPWNDKDPGTKVNIPSDIIKNMLDHKAEWVLAFNTTGIKRSSCVHMNYFGLYNCSTGTLRVFYYWPASLIPESGANDHMWYMRFKGSQAQHNSTQFAVPIHHKLDPGTDGYENFEKRAGTHYTTALTDEMKQENNYVIVPKMGWWAFDVDLSAMREKSFFDNYQPVTIGMDLFDQQNVVLNSVIKGSLDGSIDGNVNLKGLLPASTSGWAKVVPHVLTAGGSMLTNKFALDCFWGTSSVFGNVVINNNDGNNGGDNAQAPIRPRFATAWGLAAVAVGTLLTMAGNISKEYGKEGAGDKESLGNLNADVNLALNATMLTQGLIRSQRSHKVPEVTIPVEYLRNVDGSAVTKAGGSDAINIGHGLWNIQEDPVVYVVKDAYWANKAQATYYSRTKLDWYRSGQERASYDISMSPYQLGMRLISFFDPSSIGGLTINEDIFGKPDYVRLAVSYGVYPGSEPGYTDWFREATSMEYKPLTLSTAAKDGKVSTGSVPGAVKAPFRVLKKPYNNALFDVNFTNPYPDDVGRRFSAQTVNNTFDRHYFGNSLYPCNPHATYGTVDEVMYVADPQIFIPYDESKRTITDPDIPDMVVSVYVAIHSQGPMDDEPTWRTYTLRYIPRVEFIGVNEVKGIADKILAKENGGLPSNVNYITTDVHNGIIRAYSQEIATQLAK